MVTTVGGETVLITPAGGVVRVSDGKILQSDLANLEYCAPVVHEGMTYFIEHGGKAIEQVAMNEMERFGSSPVFAESRMYIRGKSYMYCIGEK